jgi:hypothetical protein
MGGSREPPPWRSGLAGSSRLDRFHGSDGSRKLFDIRSLEYEQSGAQQLAFFHMYAIGEAFLFECRDLVVIGFRHCETVAHDFFLLRAFGFFVGIGFGRCLSLSI